MTGIVNVQVVVNPVSGGNSGRRALWGLCRRMREAGMRVSTHETRGAGDARRTAARCAAEGASLLVVAGGDGTVNEAVNGLRGSGVPVLVVPAGTENILAKYFRMRLDADWLWEVVRAGRAVDLDVAACGDKRMMLVTGIGFDAEVVRVLSRVRNGHINHLSYFWPLWRTFWSYRHPRLCVEADGRLIHDGPGLALVGNLPRYAIGLRLWPAARPDDGLLDVVVFGCRWQGALLRHAVNALLNRHAGSRGVVHRQAKRVRVWSDRRVPVQVDGDRGGRLPVEIVMSGEKARFLVPEAFQA